ncbi:hypothetical protein P5673_003758 [Acropora cervicornis]|uniref:Uncharacterized protein n=1 Tax=Acropora cervicornis TaxID=6130 RepID=A0AAD9R1N4_ACRCE|nr:hypothetical protein P5673_003758 [Acropora cervicornis]
MLLACRTNH